MRNAGLDEAQAGIKIAGRNINHLRYADDTILIAKFRLILKKVGKTTRPFRYDLKLESRLLGEISITSDMQMTPLLWQKMKRN